VDFEAVSRQIQSSVQHGSNPPLVMRFPVTTTLSPGEAPLHAIQKVGVAGAWPG
jgi:hypothetical protein